MTRASGQSDSRSTIALPATRSASALLDIAPFAHRCCRSDQHVAQVALDYDPDVVISAGETAGAGGREPAGDLNYGLQWAEERDVSGVVVNFSGDPVPTRLQYWFRNWPYKPPKMPTIEDPVDDPWQGKWLTAAVQRSCEQAGADTRCQFSFDPLRVEENPNAVNMPGVRYRRALKLRLVFENSVRVGAVQVFSGSVQKPIALRVELGVQGRDGAPPTGESPAQAWAGRVRVYNGTLEKLALWQPSPGDEVNGSQFSVTAGPTRHAGLLVNLIASGPSMPGSQDITVVTLDSGPRTFSFAVPDVEKGPVYVPDFHAYVTLASDARDFSPAVVQRGQRIRERLATEPEQTYERAMREIPRLDPVHREGERLYLPLAADASWQKFALQWGGNIFVSKRATKAKGHELSRLEWEGDRIDWRLGTGSTPNYRPETHDSSLSVLEDYLPVATAKWTTEGIRYSEEAFATLLSGPLSPDDAGRDEQTPAVLMIRLTMQLAAGETEPLSAGQNASSSTAHVWLATDPVETVGFKDDLLLGGNGTLIRARVTLPEGAHAETSEVSDGDKRLNGLHVTVPLDGGGAREAWIAIPFIPRLTETERTRLTSLDYSSERDRVIEYWRGVTASVAGFELPERRFTTFPKAVIPHIRISATKDPRSGLYMVPAASYVYGVFANEAVFQCVTLDVLGDHQLAEKYLETLVRLQGSHPFEGTFTGDQKAVYHGARVDDQYDYTTSEYNLDHGTVLWALTEHYFLSGDRAWLQRVAPSMMRAADWIVEQRGLTMLTEDGAKVREYGLLPAGHLEDNQDWSHWFAVNAYAAAGFRGLAEALEDTAAPEAAKYRREADDYMRDLRAAILRAAQDAPVVRLRDNTYVPYVPAQAYQRFRLFGPQRVGYYSRYPQHVLPLYRLAADREVLYGPMILLNTGIFQPHEALAEWVLDDWEDNVTMSSSLGINVHGWVDDRYWFSRGGMVFQANLQNPILVYLHRNEIPAAIRNLYNDFVSCYYPEVDAFTEEYHKWNGGSGPFYKIPDEARFVNRLAEALVRSTRESAGNPDTVWLAAGVPRRWLAPGGHIGVHGISTYFGPASYTLTAGANRLEAEVQLPPQKHFGAAWLVLRLPAGTRIKNVSIDGAAWPDFSPQDERIRLPLKTTAMRVVVDY